MWRNNQSAAAHRISIVPGVFEVLGIADYCISDYASEYSGPSVRTCFVHS